MENEKNRAERYKEEKEAQKRNANEFNSRSQLEAQYQSVLDELDVEITQHQKDIEELDKQNQTIKEMEAKNKAFEEQIKMLSEQNKYQGTYIKSLERRPVKREEREFEQKIVAENEKHTREKEDKAAILEAIEALKSR